MNFFFERLLRMRIWIDDEGGQDLIEYALLVLFIVLVVVAAVGQVGQTLVNVYFDRVPDALTLP